MVSLQRARTSTGRVVRTSTYRGQGINKKRNLKIPARQISPSHLTDYKIDPVNANVFLKKETRRAGMAGGLQRGGFYSFPMSPAMWCRNIERGGKLRAKSRNVSPSGFACVWPGMRRQ